MGKKGDLSNFEHGMVVGARLSISQSGMRFPKALLANYGRNFCHYQ